MVLKVASIFKWLSSFLHSHLQRVVLNGTSSHWDWVKSGVLQGSVLGPLLFILISDLADNVTCGIKLFADDTKIYSTIKETSDMLLLRTKELWYGQWVVPQNGWHK